MRLSKLAFLKNLLWALPSTAKPYVKYIQYIEMLYVIS